MGQIKLSESSVVLQKIRLDWIIRVEYTIMVEKLIAVCILFIDKLCKWLNFGN